MRICSAWEKLTIGSGDKKPLALCCDIPLRYGPSNTARVRLLLNIGLVSHRGEGNAKYFTGIQLWQKELLESGWYKTCINIYAFVAMPLYCWLSLVSLFQHNRLAVIS